jgi:hypothetical protein
MKEESPNRKTADSFASSFSSSGNKPANEFDDILARMRQACGVNSDKKLSQFLDVKYSSITTARKRGAIPSAWYLKISEKFGVSMDWLHSGEGEMKRDGVRFAGPATTRKPLAGETVEAPASYDRQGILENVERFLRSDLVEPSHKAPSIGDLLAKTAKVLESDTVYRDALHSNIEAFYHGVTLEQKISNMEVSINSRLDALEAENRQLRQELEQSRAGSTLSDTG